jgi:pSer/pThr/pTyr-binding forkhead associated (FHA) protein
MGGPVMGGPVMGGPMGDSPMGGPMMGGPMMGGPMPGRPSGPVGGFPGQPAGAVPPFGPVGGTPGMGSEPLDPTVPPSMPPSPSPISLGMMPTSLAAPALRAAPAATIACPRCGTQTPLGFAYCQQCGLHMQALQPTDPAGDARPRGPTSPPPLGIAFGGKLDRPIDPHAGTIAQDDLQAGSLPGGRAAPASSPQPGPGWGTGVLVNRDGSDGQRYPLAGEYLVIGRAGADIAFDEDRFLARQHARLERGGDGVIKVQSLDTLNGVFRKADAPVELADGTTILVGREVLRFERVEPEEAKVHPLVRHGVALFGSPPREPWGRLVQLVPSGGYRDVRHLAGEEIVLGREEGDLVFRDDAFMSRRHAAVTWDGKRAQITDLGSSNGTFIRITGPTVLRHGDHIRLGDQLLRIELGR